MASQGGPIDEAAEAVVSADLGVYFGQDNTSTFKLEQMIRPYLEVIGGQHGGLYHGIATSKMGAYLRPGYGGDNLAWGENDAVDVKMLDKLKGIEWGWIADPATRLAHVARFAGGDLQDDVLDVAKRLGEAWPDKVGQLASRKLKQLASAMTAYGQSANAFAAALGAPSAGLHDVTLKSVNGIVDFCNHTSAPFVQYMNSQINIGDLRDRLDAVETRLSLGVTYGDDHPFTLQNMRQPGLKIGQNDGGSALVSATISDNWYSDFEITRLVERYFDPYRESVTAFRKCIRTAYTAVTTVMGGLSDHLSGADWSPFDVLGTDPKNDPPPQHSGGGATGGTSRTTFASSAGGHGAPSSGSYGAGISAPSMASVPASAPQVPAVPQSTSASSVSVPDQSETVTITDGNRQIAVQSPDGQGNVKITIDDGSGKPKSYDLDFGDSSGQGTRGTGASATPQNAEPVKAGAGAKAVVHDGPLTITAERPDGGPDQLKVTVDDGSGHPTTYGIDYRHDSPDAPQADHPTASPAVGPHAAAGHGGSPATAEHPTHPGADQLTTAGTSSAQVAHDTTVPQATAEPLTSGGALGSPSLPDRTDHQQDSDQGVMHPAGPGDAALATAPDAAGDPGNQQGGMGGMPMMGGMGGGAGGGGGGGGGDGQRNGGAWRTTGNLFDEEPAGTSIAEGSDEPDWESDW